MLLDFMLQEDGYGRDELYDEGFCDGASEYEDQWREIETRETYRKPPVHEFVTRVEEGSHEGYPYPKTEQDAP